ncbi:HK97 gp10 family phage protein [Rhizobium indicum]|uniref:HK97-gp10 family putative phage morphogenesis protein n=1 Tax=Rhizobium indicum TaxID=2583231 RepID=UPI001106C092|nr:HK97-gp10 family putative phage morphogenesis protein [Rhizobium indicum]QKK28895.1 HK97 gp10 family phage protein [Rhizobium indicum]
MSQNRTLSQQSAELSKRLNAIPHEILDALRPALLKSGEEVAAAAAIFAEASRDSGALIDSIAVTGPGETTPAYAEGGGKRTAGPNQVLVTVGNETMRHGHFIEFGTVNIEPQPFLRPGLRTVKPRIERRTSRAIATALKKYNAR